MPCAQRKRAPKRPFGLYHPKYISGSSPFGVLGAAPAGASDATGSHGRGRRLRKRTGRLTRARDCRRSRVSHRCSSRRSRARSMRRSSCCAAYCAPRSDSLMLPKTMPSGTIDTNSTGNNCQVMAASPLHTRRSSPRGALPLGVTTCRTGRPAQPLEWAKGPWPCRRESRHRSGSMPQSYSLRAPRYTETITSNSHSAPDSMIRRRRLDDVNPLLWVVLSLLAVGRPLSVEPIEPA